MRRVLLSIKPGFADLIFRSDKTVELRKRVPNLQPGDELLVYASSPVMAIIGAVEVVDVVEKSPSHLWRLVKAHAAVERAFYEQYYQDHTSAYGIFLGRTRLYRTPCALTTLRAAWPGFTPPQNYRYVQVWNHTERPLIEAGQIRPTIRMGQFGVLSRP